MKNKNIFVRLFINQPNTQHIKYRDFTLKMRKILLIKCNGHVSHQGDVQQHNTIKPLWYLQHPIEVISNITKYDSGHAPTRAKFISPLTKVQLHA